MKFFTTVFFLLVLGLPHISSAASDTAYAWRAGDKVSIPRILFEGSSVKLSASAADSLKPLSSFLLQHPEYRVEIGAHFRQGADVNYARNITELRAEACCEKLVSWNIPPQQISAKGYGMSQPLVHPSGEATINQRQQPLNDERIEAKIVAVIKTLRDTDFYGGDIVVLPWDFFPAETKTKKDTLRQIARILESDTTRRIEIGVFTDDDGNDVMNRQISEARARGIYELLIQDYHVPKRYLRFKGYGETVPLVDKQEMKNATSKQKQPWREMNKRIELKFFQ